jgi:glycosyltransferase involved in cell wall biosynthesis
MMSARRILILGSFMNLAGAPLAALRLAHGFAGRGHAVEAVFLYEKAPMAAPDHPYRVLLDQNSPGPVGYLRLVWRTFALIRSERPDAVITFLPLANVLGLFLAWLLRVPSRIASHRVTVDSTHPLLQRIDALLMRFGVYTDVVAVSEGVRQSCRLYSASDRDRVDVVHNGLLGFRPSALTRAQAREAFGLPADRFVILAVGRLSAQKNFGFLVTLAARCPDALWIIAGEGPQRDELSARVAASGLEDSVRLLGAVPRARMPDLLAAADLFAQPSLFEGQSNALLEAMSAGLPSISTDIPEQRETLAEPDGAVAGALLPVDDVEAWTLATSRFMGDAGARSAARDVAARRAALFTFDRMMDGFERIVLRRA